MVDSLTGRVSVVFTDSQFVAQLKKMPVGQAVAAALTDSKRTDRKRIANRLAELERDALARTKFYSEKRELLTKNIEKAKGVLDALTKDLTAAHNQEIAESFRAAMERGDLEHALDVDAAPEWNPFLDEIRGLIERGQRGGFIIDRGILFGARINTQADASLSINDLLETAFQIRGEVGTLKLDVDQERALTKLPDLRRRLDEVALAIGTSRSAIS